MIYRLAVQHLECEIKRTSMGSLQISAGPFAGKRGRGSAGHDKGGEDGVRHKASRAGGLRSSQFALFVYRCPRSISCIFFSYKYCACNFAARKL